MFDHDAADDPQASYEDHPVNHIEPEPEEMEIPSDVLKWLKGRADYQAKIYGWLVEPVMRSVPVQWDGKLIVSGEQRLAPIVSPKRVGLRCLAFVYALRPDLLPKETSISISRRMKLTRSAFSKHVHAFRTAFGLQTRVMRSPAARAAMRQAALDWHRKRRQSQA